MRRETCPVILSYDCCQLPCRWTFASFCKPHPHHSVQNLASENEHMVLFLAKFLLDWCGLCFLYTLAANCHWMTKSTSWQAFQDYKFSQEELFIMFKPYPWTVLQDAGETAARVDSSVWDSSVKRNNDKIKAVQWNAARFTCHDYGQTSNVSVMLQKLNWESLQ